MQNLLRAPIDCRSSLMWGKRNWHPYFCLYSAFSSLTSQITPPFLWATTSSHWQSWASPETPLNWALHLRPCSQKLEFHVIFTTKPRWEVLTFFDRTGKSSSEQLKWHSQGLRDSKGQNLASNPILKGSISSLLLLLTDVLQFPAQARVYLSPEPIVLHFATCSQWKEDRSES